jgi:translation initiation factor IF-3
VLQGISAHKYGITKKSNLFKINGIVCSWEQTDTAEEGAMDLIKLKKFKNKPILKIILNVV